MARIVNDKITEVIFVGLPGPTHHYGGLSGDNIASSTNRGSASNPRQAALQALELVDLLLSLGVTAAILPPQLRPHLPLLREHFSGSDEDIIIRAAKEDLPLLEKASSVSAMWTANAATVAPAIDCADKTLHITVANLYTHLHRRIEAEDTYRTLSAIFRDVPDCEIHPPLAPAAELRDEGAANHMRLSPSHSATGLHIFVYGTDGARQSLAASKAIAAQHCLPDKQTLFLKQNPDIIGQGVFHNDVIAVSNEHVLLTHENAYEDGRRAIESIAERYRALHKSDPTLIVIGEEELSVAEAVHTYIFNSQMVSTGKGTMAIIAPEEAQTLYKGKAARLLERICEDNANPIEEIHYADLRQSMRNGGGPACLRLRVPMTKVQLKALGESVNVLANEKLLGEIAQVIEKYYPDILSPQDLGNPALYHASKTVLAELSEAMRLPLPSIN